MNIRNLYKLIAEAVKLFEKEKTSKYISEAFVLNVLVNHNGVVLEYF